MANSLEVRVPLLDHKVVEFAFSLPLHMKLQNGKGKYLLRKSMKSLLPPDILDAPKMGFRIPIVPWIQRDLRPWAEDILLRDSLATPFLDTSGVRQVWDWFQSGRSHLGDLLGILLSFSLSSRIWAKTGRCPAGTDAMEKELVGTQGFEPQTSTVLR